MGPRVRVGGRYAMEEGQIEVDSIEPLGFPDITPELARESGFLGVLDLLKVAKHGRGEKIYLVRFHYEKTSGKQRAESRGQKAERKKVETREEKGRKKFESSRLKNCKGKTKKKSNAEFTEKR